MIRNYVSANKLILGCVVWGEEYLELFVGLVMPNHLSMLRCLSKNELRSIEKYIIVTDDAGETFIKNNQSYKDIVKYVWVEVVISASGNIQADKYKRMSEYMNKAIVEAIALDAFYVCLAPDTIMDSVALKTLIGLSKKGYRVVEVFSLRVSKQKFDSLWGKGFFENGVQVDVRPRELLSVALKSIHDSYNNLFFKGHKFNIVGMHGAIYNMNDRGFILASNYYHPIMFKPKVEIDENDTIDLKYLQISDYCFESEMFVVDDSDILAHISLYDDNEQVSKWMYKAGSFDNLFDILDYSINQIILGEDYQLKFLLAQKNRFHSIDIDGNWSMYEAIFDSWHKKVLEIINNILGNYCGKEFSFLNKLNCYNRVSVFGFGSCGQKLVEFLIGQHISLYKIFDNNLQNTEKNLTNITAPTVGDICTNDIIIIASDWYRDILQQLRSMHYDKKIVIAFWSEKKGLMFYEYN